MRVFIQMEVHPPFQRMEVCVFVPSGNRCGLSLMSSHLNKIQLLILGFLLQKVSTPDLLKPLAQESPKRATSPVLKQEDRLSSPAPTPLFSGGWRHGSLISINSTCTEMGNFDNTHVTGEIEFAIRYCFRAHSLEICIQACKNLACCLTGRPRGNARPESRRTRWSPPSRRP